jgi:PleD family two-component response regulator
MAGLSRAAAAGAEYFRRMTAETTPRALRIIVADDDPDSVLTLTTVLRDEGHDVRGYHQAGDALRAMREFDPDAVLTQLAGFDHHLVKPCETSDVLRLLAPVRSRICQQ